MGILIIGIIVFIGTPVDVEAGYIGDFDPTTSEYYVAPVSDEEWEIEWGKHNTKGDEWYMDLIGNIHLGEIGLNETRNLPSILTSINENYSNRDIYFDKKTKVNGISFFINGIYSGVYGLNNLEITGLAQSMFEGVQTIDTDFRLLDVSNITDMSSMFSGVRFKDLDLSSWDTSKVVEMDHMFRNTKLVSVDVSNFNMENVTNIAYMFYTSWDIEVIDVSKWVTSNLRYGDMAFVGTPKTTTLDVSKWNTVNLETAKGMFGETGAKSIDVSNWNTSKLRDISHMFQLTVAEDIDVSKWDTGKLENVSYMFDRAYLENIDLSEWDTSSLKNVNGMFKLINTDNLKSVNLSGFTFSDKLTDVFISENDPNIKHVDFTGFSFDKLAKDSINLKNLETMKVNESVYSQENPFSSYMNADWYNEDNTELRVKLSDFTSSEIVRDNPGVWVAGIPDYMYLSTEDKIIDYKDIKIGSSYSHRLRLILDYNNLSKNGVVITGKLTGNSENISLSIDGNEYPLNKSDTVIYRDSEATSNKTIDGELNITPINLGALNDTAIWTMAEDI